MSPAESGIYNLQCTGFKHFSESLDDRKMHTRAVRYSIWLSDMHLAFRPASLACFHFPKSAELHNISRTFHVLRTMQVSVAISRGRVGKAECINLD